MARFYTDADAERVVKELKTIEREAGREQEDKKERKGMPGY